MSQVRLKLAPPPDGTVVAACFESVEHPQSRRTSASVRNYSEARRCRSVLAQTALGPDRSGIATRGIRRSAAEILDRAAPADLSPDDPQCAPSS